MACRRGLRHRAVRSIRSSRSSIQWRTGVRVPDCEMRQAADVRGGDHVRARRFERAQLVRLAACRRAPAAGSSTCPAEPQHRCASATGSQLEAERAAASPRPRPRICMPCCSVHGEWNAIRCAPGIHRDQRRDLASIRRRRSRSGRARARRSAPPCPRRRRRARAGGRSPCTITPQPLAVTTIASAPRSTCGHHASMLRAHDRRAPRRARSGDTAARRSSRRRRTRIARDADAVEHARRRGVDVRRERRLHAAFQHQHLARVARRRPRARPAPRPGCDRASSRGSNAFDHAAQRPARAPNSGRDSSALRSAQRCARVGRRAADALARRLAADVDQPAVLHARRARGLAAAAGQAAVEMQLRLRGDRARLRAPA